MQLEVIIQALRERCPSFANRVGGAAQFKLLPENASLTVPCAFVLPLDDSPKESKAENSVRQQMVDSFSVIVAISNATDERGQGGVSSVKSLRTELWAGLLGWKPDVDYNGINYEGGSLLALDRARLWYQFEFGAEMEIGPEDGWQDTSLVGLPHFDGITFTSDYIDPADPNRLTASHQDGRTEVAFSVPQNDAAILP